MEYSPDMVCGVLLMITFVYVGMTESPKDIDALCTPVDMHCFYSKMYRALQVVCQIADANLPCV